MPIPPLFLDQEPSKPGTVGGSTTTVTLPTTQDTAEKNIGIIVSILSFVFGTQNLAASLNESQLYSVVPDTAYLAIQQGVVMPFRGSVVGLSFKSNAAISTGSATFRVYREATYTDAALEWTSGSDGYVSFPQAVYGFSAGDELDVRVTTSSAYTPTTNDVTIQLFVVLDTSTSA